MTVLSSHADAFVNHDPTTDVWSIGSAAVAISVGFGPGHELQLWQVLNMETGRRWAIAPEADAAVSLASVPTTLGEGLTFSGATAVDAHAFAPQYRDLGFGEQVTLGSDGRSSERFVPIAAVDGGADAFVVGSMWSGAWQMAFNRRGTQLTATIAYPRLTTTVVSN